MNDLNPRTRQIRNSSSRLTIGWLAAVLFLGWLGCGDKTKRVVGQDRGAPTARSDSTDEPSNEGRATDIATDIATASDQSTQVKKKWAKLADSPTIDVLANRYLLHVGGDAELVVPIASESLRKYDQAYSRPWAIVVPYQGVQGRVLSKRATSLQIPWRAEAGAAKKIIANVAGLAGGQRISLRVNGKVVGERSIAEGWQRVDFPAKGIHAGENEIGLFVRKRGIAGGTSSWGLWHSLVIVADDVDASDRADPLAQETSRPNLEPVAELTVDGETREAITGFTRTRYYVEIPESAHLVFDSGVASGTSEFVISVTDSNGVVAELFKNQQPMGWKSHQLSLNKYAGKLVVLDFATSAPAASGFAKVQIAIEKTAIRPRPASLKNAILVVVDALRADRLKAYNPSTRVTAPRMNGEIASRGAVFLHSQAASPSSPPSHGSIQTGMIPRVHGVVGDHAEIINGTPMLSTQARKAGIAAGYYGNNSFGMARLEKPGNWTAFHQPPREGMGNDCSTLIPQMLSFVKQQSDAGKRFVLSSLPYEPHTAYRYHEGISNLYHSGSWDPPVGKRIDGVLLSALSDGKTSLTDSQWSQLFALYDGEVTYFVSCFGTLIDGLKQLGVADDTAIILTSDHGEGMHEHGKMGHAWGHNAEVGNIPLTIMAKGFTDGGQRHDIVASHLDIVPTILDLLGVEIDPRVQGRSLVPMMLRDGPWIPRVVSLEYGRSYSLRARQWRYIVDYQGKESLYDLAADPKESTNVVSSAPIALRYLRDSAGIFLAHRTQWTARRWGDFNNHTPAFAKQMAPR